MANRIAGARYTLDGTDVRLMANEGAKSLQHTAELTAPSGLKLRVASDQPGAQVYTGHGLGAPFEAWDGICIEPSGFPNAANLPDVPSVICTPASPYVQKLVLEVRE